MTANEDAMRRKLEAIREDPEAYCREARRRAYREEFKRAYMPWRKPKSPTR